MREETKEGARATTEVKTIVSSCLVRETEWAGHEPRLNEIRLAEALIDGRCWVNRKR